MIERIETTKLLCTCDVCGFKWTAKGETPPGVCGKCKSYNWNRIEDQKGD